MIPILSIALQLPPMLSEIYAVYEKWHDCSATHDWSSRELMPRQSNAQSRWHNAKPLHINTQSVCVHCTRLITHLYYTQKERKIMLFLWEHKRMKVYSFIYDNIVH